MKHLSTWLLACLAVFAPERGAFITVITLTVADLICGLLAARKRGELITSAGLKRTLGKIALYEVALALAYLAQVFLIGPILPAANIVAAVIGMTELKSVLENLDTISGGSILKIVIARIASTEGAMGGKTPPSDTQDQDKQD